MPKRITIAGGDSWYNRGDAAILAGSLQMLRDAIPEADITILSDAPQLTAQNHPGFAVLPRRNLAQVWQHFQHTDIFLWGGGQLIQNESSHAFLLFQLALVTLALQAKVPVVCFAQGVGKVKGTLLRQLTRLVLNRLTAITVRDAESAQQLVALGVTTPVQVFADPAIYLEAATSAQVTPALAAAHIPRPYAIIAPRRWFHYRHAWLPVAWQAAPNRPNPEFDNLVQGLSQLADTLIDQHHLHVVFVPMYPGPEQGDEEVSQRIQSQMRFATHSSILTSAYPPAIFKGIFGAAEVALGIRLHSTILATSTGVPALTLYYQQKGLSYFRQLGIESWAFPIEHTDWARVQTQLQTILAERVQLKGFLLTCTQALKKTTYQNAVLIQQLLNGSKN